jgi:chemotaxis protein MotB
MHYGLRLAEEEGVSPYIALADLCINLVLILAFFVAATTLLGKVGWDQVRYKDQEREFAEAVAGSLRPAVRPQEVRWRNDPPGAQRWVFTRAALFVPGTSILTPEGTEVLTTFAELLNRHRRSWRRIRVEGHTMPPLPDEPDEWALSAERAAAVEAILYHQGHIQPYLLAVSGRAGQAPLYISATPDPRNERVEIVVEYATRAAQGG